MLTLIDAHSQIFFQLSLPSSVPRSYAILTVALNFQNIENDSGDAHLSIWSREGRTGMFDLRLTSSLLPVE